MFREDGHAVGLDRRLVVLFPKRLDEAVPAEHPVRLLLSTFAYVLLHHQRTAHLANTEFAPAQVDRLRLTLVKIAARVCVSARRVVFHLSTSDPYQALFPATAASLLFDTS